MRFLGYAFASVLGLAAGVAAVAVHRSPLGLLLGTGTAVVVIWTLRQWLPRSASAFAAGWLIPLVFAVAGRGEGDVAVSSDTQGWLVVASGFVILVTGIACGRTPGPPRDSASRGART